jgi:starch phosphorylase
MTKSFPTTELLTRHLRDDLLTHLRAVDGDLAPSHLLDALSKTTMGYLAQSWRQSQAKYGETRQAHYFSAEFLVGRALLNNLVNLGLYEPARMAINGLDHDLTAILEQEMDPGLGNGGLGRLAACFLDSCATLNLPVTGYGILYKYGLFKQMIDNGFQCESPDCWLEHDYPFLVRRDKEAELVYFKDMTVRAVPYDLPITGYMTANVNTLRLWKAEPVEPFSLTQFNNQQFSCACTDKNKVEDLCRVLYPNDTSYEGKVLRVRQQYFFVSASLKGLVKAHLKRFASLDNFAEENSIQLNDTHPVIAIPELMRILLHEYQFSWDKAWLIVQQTFAYTNHTVMNEALEKWETGIYSQIFPWLLDIVTGIDGQFRNELTGRGVDQNLISQMAPLGDGRVRMAPLAIYGSRSVNGVAALHTEILKRDTLKNYYKLWANKFNNKTNGVTPRRWLASCNPRLSGLLTEVYGNDSWITDLSKLQELEPLKSRESLLMNVLAVKTANKRNLADLLQAELGMEINANSIFDVQCKRLHEYKRQLLNILSVLDFYYMLKDNPDLDLYPRTIIFGAKAAPGYRMAKGVIKLIHEVGKLVNNDPVSKDKLRVAFVPNYSVTWAERIIPAADLSEQISTVGLEASGTGNMKFMMNGALTIGTLDGANVEIVEAAGQANAYIFGCTAEEYPEVRSFYSSQWHYHNVPGLKRVVDSLVDGTLNDNGSGLFQDLYNSLVYSDFYHVLGDFSAYRKARLDTDRDYRDRLGWAAKCWTNICSSGRFSSDRTIAQYASEIWRVAASPI